MSQKGIEHFLFLEIKFIEGNREDLGYILNIHKRFGVSLDKIQTFDYNINRKRASPVSGCPFLWVK